MNVRIEGGDVRYTVEQLAQTLFGSAQTDISVKTSASEKRVTAVCRISDGEKEASASAWSPRPETEYDYNHALRLTAAKALYKASLPILGTAPDWGMLSGVRPGKLIRARLEKGESLEKAEKWLEKTYFVTPKKASLCAMAGKAAFDAENSFTDKDIMLYIHIPFCPSRCSYCSFVSMSAGDYARYGEKYLECLSRELDAFADLKETRGLHVRAVYIGGGTPAILDAQNLEKLCTRVRALAPDAEFTVEAGRPDVITREKLAALKRAEVDRVCVNTQTVHDRTLEIIGRRHTSGDFFRAFDLVREAGFREINVDLIAGLPGESAEDFKKSLDSVLSLSPENITVHTLAVKRSSFLNEESYKNAPAEALHEMLDYSQSVLTAAGYAPYYLYRQKNTGGSFENIGFTKEGHACLYNICMMEEVGDVAALGAGASGKLTRGGIQRRVNPKYPREYIEGIDGVLESFRTFYGYFDEQ